MEALEATFARIGFVGTPTVRGGGASLPSMDKVDLPLSSTWEQQTRALLPGVFAKIDGAIEHARRLRGGTNAFWHLLVTYAGSKTQCFHEDNGDDPTFTTVLVDLHGDVDPARGGTEFLSAASGRSFAGGPCVVFAGDAVHRGLANRSSCPRASLVISHTDRRADANDRS